MKVARAAGAHEAARTMPPAALVAGQKRKRPAPEHEGGTATQAQSVEQPRKSNTATGDLVLRLRPADGATREAVEHIGGCAFLELTFS